MKKYLISILLGLLALPAMAQSYVPDQRGHFGQMCVTNKVNTFTKNNAFGTITAGTWNGSVIGSSFGGAGSVSGVLKANGSGTVSQAACADLSNGATGCSTTVGTSATVNTGTSGATIPLLNGNNTASGNNIQSGTYAITGTSLPAQAGGTFGLAGTASAPTLGANSEGDIWLTATGGINLLGQGSTNDFSLFNKGGTSVCTVATGTTNWNCTGLQVGGTAVLTANQSITLSGDTTGSGATAITTTTSKVNGVSYGISPSTNTVPVVTSSNTVTYEAVPLAALNKYSQAMETTMGFGTFGGL